MMARGERAGVLDMLSLEKCREILGESFQITEGELRELRMQLYDIAGVVVEAAEHNLDVNSTSDFGSILDSLPDYVKEDAEERAAILEYDAGFSTDHAERLALTNVIRFRGEDGRDRHDRQS